MIKVAVVGLGKMGLLHASLLNVVPECKVVAICEKSQLLRHFSKNMFTGVTVVSDVRKLTGLNLDAVYITTPTSTHCAIVKSIIDLKTCRNIFVEKPLANNIIQSKQICALVKMSGKQLATMVGYNRRFNVVFRKARELIQTRFTGNIASFEGYAFSSDFLGSSQTGKRVNRGGVLRDLGCHAIDLTLWCLGKFNYKKIDSSSVTTDGTIDSIDFEVNNEKGITGKIKASWCEPNYRLPEIGIIVEDSQGQRLSANDDRLEFRDKQGNVKTWHKQDLDDNVHYMLGSTDYYREDAEFINAIKTGKQVEPSFATASAVDDMIDAAEKSLLRQNDGR